ncbi:MAG TPA: hypothetical protein VK487_01965 [Candidatus Bathyarchaeia archaeon]|nr:hypothetical protein [Candidatus Bathyarchaeia archaeon]
MRDKFVVYLHTIDRSIVYDAHESAKEAVTRAMSRHGEGWNKLPLIQRNLALEELNNKIEQALQESAEQTRHYKQEETANEKRNRFAMPSP